TGLLRPTALVHTRIVPELAPPPKRRRSGGIGDLAEGGGFKPRCGLSPHNGAAARPYAADFCRVRRRYPGRGFDGPGRRPTTWPSAWRAAPGGRRASVERFAVAGQRDCARGQHEERGRPDLGRDLALAAALEQDHVQADPLERAEIGRLQLVVVAGI